MISAFDAQSVYFGKRIRKRNSNKISKTGVENRHACRRAQTRYGLDYTPELQKIIVREIQQNTTPGRIPNGVCIGQKSNTRTTWFVEFTDPKTNKFRQVLVGYDKKRKTIATFLEINSFKFLKECQTRLEELRKNRAKLKEWIKY